MDWLIQGIGLLTNNAEQVTQVVGAFALVATMTPNKSDDRIVDAGLRVVNALGGNIGKAQNGGLEERIRAEVGELSHDDIIARVKKRQRKRTKRKTT